MEARKLVKKIAFVLISLYVFVLLGLSIYQHARIRMLSHGVNPDPTITDGSLYDAAPGKDRIDKNTTLEDTNFAGTGKDPYDTDDIEKQLYVTEKNIDTANAQLSDELIRQKALRKTQEELYNKIDIEQFKQRFASEYGPLVKELNLSHDELNDFKQLLVDKYAASRGVKIDIVNGEEIIKEFKNEDKAREYEIKINELLGYEGYEIYRAYEDNGRKLQVQ